MSTNDGDTCSSGTEHEPSEGDTIRFKDGLTRTGTVTIVYGETPDEVPEDMLVDSEGENYMVANEDVIEIVDRYDPDEPLTQAQEAFKRDVDEGQRITATLGVLGENNELTGTVANYYEDESGGVETRGGHFDPDNSDLPWRFDDSASTDGLRIKRESFDRETGKAVVEQDHEVIEIEVHDRSVDTDTERSEGGTA